MAEVITNRHSEFTDDVEVKETETEINTTSTEFEFNSFKENIDEIHKEFVNQANNSNDARREVEKNDTSNNDESVDSSVTDTLTKVENVEEVVVPEVSDDVYQNDNSFLTKLENETNNIEDNKKMKDDVNYVNHEGRDFATNDLSIINPMDNIEQSKFVSTPIESDYIEQSKTVSTPIESDTNTNITSVKVENVEGSDDTVNGITSTAGHASDAVEKHNDTTEGNRNYGIEAIRPASGNNGCGLDLETNLPLNVVIDSKQTGSDESITNAEHYLPKDDGTSKQRVPSENVEDSAVIDTKQAQSDKNITTTECHPPKDDGVSKENIPSETLEASVVDAKQVESMDSITSGEQYSEEDDDNSKDDISHETSNGKDDVEATKESDQLQDEWLDILGNGLLKKKIIKKGNGHSTRPVSGDIIDIKCEGKLNNGTVVDKHSNLQFILSDEDVIQAFDLAVALMEDQEVALVYTDARYAYGIYGRADYKPPIPQNVAITYEIEILSVKEGLLVSNMTSQERGLYGDKKRIRGNDLYLRGDFSGSINAYKRGLKYLEGCDDANVLQMKVKCLNNLSAAQLKVRAYIMSIQSLDTVLQLEPENVKALFRKGKCLDALGKEEEALQCMKQASMLDPQNKTIVQELGRLRSRLAVTHQKEKQMYQRMFQQKKADATDGMNDGGSNWPYIIGSVAVAAAGIIAGWIWLKNR